MQTYKSMVEVMNRVRYLQVSSSMARSALGRIYKTGGVYTVPFGPLRGAKLQYDPTITFHTMLGLWEYSNLDLIDRTILRHVFSGNEVICDIGANLGTYALYFARKLPKSTVYAFEPVPEVLQRLANHVKLNACRNVVLVPLACSDHSGCVEMYIGDDHHVSSLLDTRFAREPGATKSIQVQATSVDEFFFGATPKPPPHLIKMDIEGGGTLALPGCATCLREARPMLLVESHSPAEDKAISNILVTYDYQALRLDDRKWVSHRTETYPDRQGVWGTLLVCPAQQKRKIEQGL